MTARKWFGTALFCLLFAGMIRSASAGPLQGDSSDVHDPARAVANLDVHGQLEATLFASEPAITNPTNLDIDARGRVWICDVMNYRGNNGKRPEGDRILILEDTNGDGRADSTKVYYQGRDIDSAMGICVLANKVIVSASPNIFVFTDEDGDDKPDKKELLFSKTGQPQHDHSAHSFVFGPDGKLYWNFGNTGREVRDRDGNLVVDRSGNKVVDNGKPYFGGMVFRCDVDGSNFEVLAHNFRNNYETAVDSFGTLWQSDNDDDGNRAVRMNYVMEFGNYGYKDEMTGAGWNTPRTNLETEVPVRHWHQNDPGVVPNLLLTGAGSPTGIIVYEGRLLPREFWNQVVHCDAGPSVVRAYPVTKQGAGYRAEIVNILEGTRNQWFRPADVCVAPDGSIFVTDWYDPGVGGHGQRDTEKGRIFRVAPRGSQYKVPKLNFASPTGAIEALKNPNLATRYLGWTALREMGAGAEPALHDLAQDAEPHLRARALWLLGKINGRGSKAVEQAIQDRDPDIRTVGIRLARQLDMDVTPLVERLLHDASPQVRRELAIALRPLDSEKAAALWTGLALQHDPADRWYLEALGIAADGKWDKFLAAWLAKVGQDWNSPAGRDIVWRSRAAVTPGYLAKVIETASVPTGELPRYFRAFDFQSGEKKQPVLMHLAFVSKQGDEARRSLVALEAVQRLEGFSIQSKPEYAAALEPILDRAKGTSTFVELVDRFQVASRYADVLAIAVKHRDQQFGVQAMKLLLKHKQQAIIQQSLDRKDEQSVHTAEVLGGTGDDAAAQLLLPIVHDATRAAELRRQATRAAAKTRRGAQSILELAQNQKLAEELKDAASYALHAAPWEEVKKKAHQLFPQPAGKNDTPLPSIDKLVKMRGDSGRGKNIFVTAGTCANCHKVNNEGKEVGPDLSEIGNKLSREALFESILFPSASISHNYEQFAVATKNGSIRNGIVISDTPERIEIRGADAIVHAIQRDEIEEMKKSNVSIMPADLAKQLTAQDLVDLIEFMAGLKAAKR